MFLTSSCNSSSERENNYSCNTPIIPNSATIEIIRSVFSPKIIKIEEDLYIIHIELESEESCGFFVIYPDHIHITPFYI